MRLIDAEDCLDLMYVMCAGQDKDFVAAMEAVIAETPTIEAEPVRHGKWLRSGRYEPYFVCKSCGHVSSFAGKYCAECGAKMDGKENE